MAGSSGNREIPLAWKQKVARWLRWPLLRRFMLLGVYLVVPRQRIGVAIVAFDETGRVLLLRHVLHPLSPWGLPGGWLHRGEAPPEGALRELQEETGLTAELGPVVHLSREPNPPHVGIAFLGHVQPGPVSLSPEIMEAAWVSLAALPASLLPFARHAIQAAVQTRQGLALAQGGAPDATHGEEKAN